MKKDASSKCATYCSYLILIFFLIFGLTIMISLSINHEYVFKVALDYKQVIRQNFIYSLLTLVVLHIIGALLVFPSSLFEFLCGLIFGTCLEKVNFIFGYIACVLTYLTIMAIAGVITFNFSRLIFHKTIRKHFIENNSKMIKLDRIINIYGAKALFIIRLSPLLPVALYNYILGGFNITSRMFFVSTYGSFGGALLYCFIGYKAVSFDQMLNEEGEYSIMN